VKVTGYCVLIILLISHWLKTINLYILSRFNLYLVLGLGLDFAVFPWHFYERGENTTGLSCYIPVTTLLFCISQPSNCIDFKQVNTLHFYLHFLTCLKSIQFFNILHKRKRNNVTHTDDSPFGHYFLAHHQNTSLLK
jgi:hypothetical protein